jgi:sugar phosphate isomerase/epimerase
MKKASELGPGMGVEIVGPEHHRDFPRVPKEFEAQFKNACQRYGLVPTSYGAYTDAYFFDHRNLTPDEKLAYTVPQIEGAARLGFQLVRIQPFVIEIDEKLVKYAEKYKIKLGYEIHAPGMYGTDFWNSTIKSVNKIQSPYLGLVPDMSIFETMPADSGSGHAMPPASDPDHLKDPDVAPYIIHAHGKFHRISNGEIQYIPYDKIVKNLIDIGFKGWMSTEFEGGDCGEFSNSLEVVKAHHAIVNKMIAKYSKA